MSKGGRGVPSDIPPKVGAYYQQTPVNIWNGLNRLQKLQVFNKLPGNYLEKMAALKNDVGGPAATEIEELVTTASVSKDSLKLREESEELYQEAIKANTDRGETERSFVAKDDRPTWKRATQAIWNPDDTMVQYLGNNEAMEFIKGGSRVMAVMGAYEIGSGLLSELSGSGSAASGGKEAAAASSAGGGSKTLSDIGGKLGSLSTKDWIDLGLTGSSVLSEYLGGKKAAEASGAAAQAQVAAAIRAQDMQQAQFDEQIRLLEESKATATGETRAAIDQQIAQLQLSKNDALVSFQQGMGEATGIVQAGGDQALGAIGQQRAESLGAIGQGIGQAEDIYRGSTAPGDIAAAGQRAQQAFGQAAGQFGTQEALALGQPAIGYGQQGLDKYAQAALDPNSEAMRFRLGETEEAVNRQLAARGLLNSGAGLEALQAAQNQVISEETEARIGRQRDLAGLGLGQAGAAQNILMQGGRDLSGLTERAGQAAYGSDLAAITAEQARQDQLAELSLLRGERVSGIGMDTLNPYLGALGTKTTNLANLAQTTGTGLSGLHQDFGRDVANVQGAKGSALANIATGFGTKAATAAGQFGANQANLLTQQGLAQAQGIQGQADAKVKQYTGIADALTGGYKRYQQRQVDQRKLKDMG